LNLLKHRGIVSAMLRQGCQLVALVLAVGAFQACQSSRPPEQDCELTRPPINTNKVVGSWQVVPVLPENGDDSSPDGSMLLGLGISRAPEKADAGAAGDCGPTEALLKVAYYFGDERFRNADISGVFKPTSAGTADGTLTLKLGSLSITAAIGADGTVGQTSSVWHDDGGTRNADLVLVRTGL
jgi:hypothetical protein